MALVQYYVMKRPKHPATGEIIRGKTAGATQNANKTVNQGASLWYPGILQQLDPNGTLMDTQAPLPDYSGSTSGAQVDGEPWILHSVHFNVDDAVSAAKIVVSSVGSENMRILKSIAHEVNLSIF